MFGKVLGVCSVLEKLCLNILWQICMLILFAVNGQTGHTAGRKKLEQRVIFILFEMCVVQKFDGVRIRTADLWY